MKKSDHTILKILLGSTLPTTMTTRPQVTSPCHHRTDQQKRGDSSDLKSVLDRPLIAVSGKYSLNGSD